MYAIRSYYAVRVFSANVRLDVPIDVVSPGGATPTTTAVPPFRTAPYACATTAPLPTHSYNFV